MNKQEFLKVAKAQDIKICQMDGKRPFVKDWQHINDVDKVKPEDNFGVVFPIEIGNLKVIGLDFDLKAERDANGKPIDNADARLKKLIRKELGETFKDDAIEVSCSGEGYHLLYYFKDKLPNWSDTGKKICKSINNEANKHLQAEIFMTSGTIHINKGIDLTKIKPWNDKIETFMKKYFKFTPEKDYALHQEYIGKPTKNFTKDEAIWENLTIEYPELKTFLTNNNPKSWLKYPTVWQLAILFFHFGKWSEFMKRIEILRPQYYAAYSELPSYFNKNEARIYGKNEDYFIKCSEKINYEKKRVNYIKTYGNDSNVNYEEWLEGFNVVDDFVELDKYPLLSEKIMGFRAGYLYTIVGDTSHGKSTFALNIAEMLSKKYGIVYCSLEMNIRDVEVQLIANQSYSNMRNGELPYSQKQMKGKHLTELTEMDFQSIFNTYQDFNKDRLFTLYAKSHATIDEIIALADEFNPTSGYRFIFIDNLHNISPNNITMEGRQKIDYFIAQLQKLATEKNIGVIVLAHTRKRLNGKDKDADKKIINLEDIKETSAVAQDSQFVFSLYTEKDEARKGQLTTTLSILKNRDGERGCSIEYASNFLYSHISEIPDSQQSYNKPKATKKPKESFRIPYAPKKDYNSY